ncbi:MAG TPA: hypothetical protein VNO30_00655 [Kofleriaceae bacterium]|nr:hypothetical protein [Kofleriaceae bacterium]
MGHTGGFAGKPGARSLVQAQGLRTPSGSAQIKHVRYTFTSPAGSKANVETMRKAFTDKQLATHISFEIFTPEGKLIVITDKQQLDAQRWLYE